MTARVAVLGTGLIGGSVALGLRRARPDMAIAGYDRDASALACALERGAITEVARGAQEACAGADLVVMSIPVDRIPAACRTLEASVEAHAVVTDVGSAKAGVVAAGEAVFGERFVGGHPMAGSERHGIEAADERLFDGAWWILTPTATTSSQAYATVTDFVTRLGATPVAVAPDEHDVLVARLSHVPQLTASALVDVAVSAGDREALLGLAAGGFRDVTRIAASNPELWVGILRSNKAAVLEALDRLAQRLTEVAGLLEGDRWQELLAFLDRSRTARMELFAKPDYGREPVALYMLVPDRPGVLAEVTTAAGSLGANIEDLEIFHSTEGGRGRLEVVVAGVAAADALTARLQQLGYRVERSPLEGAG